jgi:peptidoglycan/LPS O-acetylase OafA/YrhL
VINARLSSFLNASRWWAAFFVAAHHVRHIVIADAADVSLGSAFVKIFYFITGLGTQAVMVFFVVSGYLVGGTAIARFRTSGFDIGSYAASRTSRIYTVLVPALLVGGGLDWIGLHFFNGSELYTNGAHDARIAGFFSIAGNLDLPTFLGNLFMLENIVTPHLGTNSPLWSLVYEWWYYGMFGAAMVLATSRTVIWRSVAGILLVVMGVLLPHALVAWALIWTIGVGAALYGASSGWKPAPWMGYGALVIVLVIIRLTEHTAVTAHADSLSYTFACAAAVALAYAFLLLAYHRPGAPLPMAATNEAFAKFSYTLYLVHFPMIVFCVCFLHDRFGLSFLQKPSVASMGYFVALLAFVVAYAFLFSQLSERHTGHVRGAIVGTFRRMRSAGQTRAAVSGDPAG